MEGGPPRFKQDFSCPVLLRYRLGHLQTFAYGGLTLYAVPSQTLQLILQLSFVGGPTTPTGRTRWFGLFRVRSPLLAESRLISIPSGTEMFQFPEFALMSYVFTQQCMASTAMRVTPFGNPRIKRCLLFPEAYRSWPRPSSLPRAKASALRPYYLTLTVKIVNPWRPSHLILCLQNLRFNCLRN